MRVVRIVFLALLAPFLLPVPAADAVARSRPQTGGARGARAQAVAAQFPGKERRFPGLLVCVTPGTIAILQSDGVVISALLPRMPAGLTASRLSRYLLGDKVDISAVPIRQFYDPGTALDYYLRLSGLHYLGHASPAQVQAAMASSARLLRGNLLALPPGAVRGAPAPQPNALSPAPQTAMRRWIASFPNYIADAIEKNTITQSTGRLLAMRNLQETVTMANGRIAHGGMKLNGIPWTGPYLTAPVYHWNGGFAYIRAFVRSDCGIRVVAGARGHTSFTEPVDGFRFTSPANGCLGRAYMGFQSYYAPVRGNLWIARSDHLPRRLEMQYKLPSGMSARSVQMSIEWTPVRVARTHYVLPSRATAMTEMEMGWWESQMQYSHYRRFTVSSKITYTRKRH